MSDLITYANLVRRVPKDEALQGRHILSVYLMHKEPPATHLLTAGDYDSACAEARVIVDSMRVPGRMPVLAYVVTPAQDLLKPPQAGVVLPISGPVLVRDRDHQNHHLLGALLERKWAELHY